MAIQGIGAAGVSGISGAGVGIGPKAGSQPFSKTFQGQTTNPHRGEMGALQVKPPHQRAEAKATTDVGKCEVSSARPPSAGQAMKALEPTRMMDQVAAAQKRMETVLELAQSGKSFTPAELISLQSQMYRASQELDLAGKVIEKATGGVKQILQTQV